MAPAAGVAGVVDPLGKRVDAPDAGRDAADPALIQLGRLVEKDDVVLRALVLVQVAVAAAVAEGDGAAAGQAEELVGPVVDRQVVERLLEVDDVVVHQLLVGLADDEDPDTGVLQGK